MPRTFKATIALICCLALLCGLTLINVVQTNRTEDVVLQMQERLSSLEKAQQNAPRIAHAPRTNSPSTAVDECAAMLNDPGNLLQAPTKPSRDPNAKDGGTVRLNLSSQPKGFNWFTENSGDVQKIQAQVHDNLVERDRHNPERLLPELACKITANADFTEYVIHLKKGVFWQVPAVDFSDPKFSWLKQPREFTAEDVAYYFELVKDPQVEAGALKSYYADMTGVEVVDKYTLKVRWEKKVFQSRSFTLEIFPMPKWLYTRTESGEEIPKEIQGLRFNSHWAAAYPIGTGPYRITKIEKGVHIKLERHARYHGTQPAPESIRFEIVRDPHQVWLKLKAGELDLSYEGLSPDDYEKQVRGREPSEIAGGKLRSESHVLPVYYYFGWNMDSQFFKDKRVRQAMTHALDRHGIIKNVLKGLGHIQTSTFPLGHTANDPSVKPYPFDLDRAAKLLDEAGWTDTDGDGIRDKVIQGRKTPFRFDLLAYNRPTARRFVSIYKDALRKIGVQMKPQPLDWALMQKKMDEKAFDAFTGGWGMGYTQDPHQIWHSSNADVAKGSNRVAFRNQEADALIDELRLTFDPEKRTQMLRRFHRILHEEQPYTFFYIRKDAFAWRPDLKGTFWASFRPQLDITEWWLDAPAP